jgi:DNA-binding MarR family transcriptional regulator
MSPRSTARGANLLGALALAVSDRTMDAIADTTGHSESAAATLSALDQFLDHPSIDSLSKVVGLSQSGAVRLIDRLERDGLVVRGAGEDGRVTAISLTAAGRTAARTIESSRLESLEVALAPLTRGEMETFTELAGKLLVGLMREPGATRWMCRLCELSACGRPDGNCPIEREARVRYG